MQKEREFYDRNFKAVFRFFYYRGVDKQSCEDLVQDTFIVYFQKYFTKIDDQIEEKKLLYTIARNKYREWVRSLKKTCFLELDQDIPVFDDALALNHLSEDSFAGEIDTMRAQLLSAIEQLNDTVKQVIKCRFLEGMTRAQTAEKLGIKPKQVHVYQRRGIEYLKKIVSPDTY